MPDGYPRKRVHKVYYWECGVCKVRHRSENSARKCRAYAKLQKKRISKADIYKLNMDVAMYRLEGYSILATAEFFNIPFTSVGSRCTTAIKFAVKYARQKRRAEFDSLEEKQKSGFTAHGMEFARLYPEQHIKMMKDFYRHLVETGK